MTGVVAKIQEMIRGLNFHIQTFVVYIIPTDFKIKSDGPYLGGMVENADFQSKQQSSGVESVQVTQTGFAKALKDCGNSSSLKKC